MIMEFELETVANWKDTPFLEAARKQPAQYGAFPEYEGVGEVPTFDDLDFGSDA